MVSMLAAPAFADEVWSCTPELNVPHPKARNVYISNDKLWFAGGTEPYTLIENNPDHIIGFIHVVINGTRPNEKVESSISVILARASGRMTTIDDLSAYRALGDATPIINHENCSQNK